MKLRVGDALTYVGREWIVVRVEELSYFVKSPSLDGYAFGYISFAALEAS